MRLVSWFGTIGHLHPNEAGAQLVVKEIFQTIDEQIGLRTAALDEFILVVAAVLAWSIHTAVSPSGTDHITALLFAGIQFVNVVLLFLIGAYASPKRRALDIVARQLIAIAGAIALTHQYWSHGQIWMFAGLMVVIAVSSAWLLCSPVVLGMLARLHLIDPPRTTGSGVATLEYEAVPKKWRVSSGPARRSQIWLITKRAGDIAIATVVSFLTLSMLTACAVAIRLTSPGPVLYRQKRIGLNGQPFVLYKLRSMRAEAEPPDKPQWASHEDPRVTSVGRWLRRYHLDELPQLFNILKGDMSFVGPRPERPEFVELLAENVPFYRFRHAVKPGLTGWAQINHPYGASIEDAQRKLAFDLFYVERAGVLFDMFIIMRTLRVVALCQGAR